MTTLAQVMKTLESKGTDQTRRTYTRHGAGPEMFGVRVGDLKTVAKTIKGDHELALRLYETGNSDAMYLAGLVADGKKMSKKELDAWARKADWYMISEYVVPWVASESPHGRALALKWIDAKKPNVAASGWSTYSGLVTTQADEELDLGEVEGLLERVEREIGTAPNRVRYCMNGFVIAVGAYVKKLAKRAKAAAKRIGKVEVDVGNTECKVPLASEYIAKIEKTGRAGKKRKTIRC